MSAKPTEELSRELLNNELREALQESEKRYRRLVESLVRDYIIYSHDVDGNFTYLSPSVVNVLGYSQDEFMGHYSDYLTDNPINNDIENYTKDALQGKKQEPYVAEYGHKDGHKVLLRVTEVPVFDNNGKVLGIDGIVQDITELTRLETERENTIIKLKEALAEIKTLRGLLPVCCICKKIRNDEGYWELADVYIQKHSEADITHGICPECAKKHYP